MATTQQSFLLALDPSFLGESLPGLPGRTEFPAGSRIQNEETLLRPLKN